MRKTKSKVKVSEYSIIKNLKEENLIDDRFLVRVSNLPLEDIIAIKLESLSHKINGKMYGLSLARSIKKITQEALIKYARSVCTSQQETALFLGIDTIHLNRLENSLRRQGDAMA
jgi:hypothetical protein|tara:strand:+ start:866 stop:1210 length:345 start_codon:yes stop_codon:yes gene_type:complete